MLYTPPGPPLRVSTVPLVAFQAVGVVWTRQAWLLGWTLTASAAATSAVVTMYDGDPASAELLAVIRIRADETTYGRGGPPTWPIHTCLTIDPGPAPISGAILIGELWTPPGTRT